jgi:hypothetical protein
MTQPILKRTSASRPSGEWNDDDYDVLADGAVVGRIMKVHAAPAGTPWMWTLAFWYHRRARADAWRCGHPRDRHDGIRQELAARMTKKRRVYRHDIAGNQVMRPTDLGQISDCGWPGTSRNA